uniref:C2 NT-type domain-containing protein n=1 Tax=Globodera pallida TaxID=36090 RepID=A0A183C105_GLOPA
MSISFLRKKKVKFSVELSVLKLTDVPLLNAVIFAKVRLLDCGSFAGITLHKPVCSHEVDFMACPSSSHYLEPNNAQVRAKTLDLPNVSQQNGAHRHSVTCFAAEQHPVLERRNSLSEDYTRPLWTEQHFVQKDNALAEYEEGGEERNLCKESNVCEDGQVVSAEKDPQPFKFGCCIPFDSKQTGMLEACRFKISLRKEDRAGRTPQKLGFVILNLTEFAYSGAKGITRSYLVDGYDNNQRADNSRVHIFVRMQHNSADPLFQIPNSSAVFRRSNSMESLHHQSEQLDKLLNPAARKAPPSSPDPNSISATLQENSANSAVIQGRTTSQSIAVQALYTIPSQMIASTSAMSNPLSANVCTYSTVPGGFGHNMSTRVQQTRRDPGVIIDEVLAENSATLPSVRRLSLTSLSSSSSPASDEYETSST